MGVALIIILGIGIFLAVRRRRNNRTVKLHSVPLDPIPNESKRGIKPSGKSSPSSGVSTRSSGTRLSTKPLVGENFEKNMDLLSSKWEIKYADLDIQMPPIGSGAYGVVNKATYKGKLVAVKTFFNKSDPLDFQREVLVLSQLDHPSIIAFVGASLEPKAIVTEFANRGSVYDIMRKNPQSLNWERVINILIDCAKGFAYLHAHDPPVIHRDLKTQNILINENWNAQLCDFGISREMGSDLTMTKVIGTPRWNAPEVLDGDSYSEKVDVYSFGIVMWELIARKLPFEEITKQSELEDHIIEGNRPLVPPYCPPIYKEIMERCWKAAPEERPSFDEVVTKLELSKRNERVEDSQLPQDFEGKNGESGKVSRSNTKSGTSALSDSTSDSNTVSNVDSNTNS